MKKFVLVDGYISMDNSTIQIKIDEFKGFKKIIFLLFFFAAYVLDKYRDYKNGEFPTNGYHYFKLCFIAIVLLVVIYSAYHFIFRRNYKKKISINEIETLDITDDEDNENEIEIDLIRDNKRIQKLKFRKLENQLEPFLSELKKRNSRIKFIEDK